MTRPLDAGRDGRPGPDAESAPAVEPAHGIPTEARFFLGLGAFFVLLTVLYGVTTARSTRGTEYTGVLVLAAGAGFSLFFGVFLLLRVRHLQADFVSLEASHAEGDPAADDVLYLPSTSIWPIGIGFGLSLALAGVPLGLWVMVPGLALFLHSVLGFARQSRDRG